MSRHEKLHWGTGWGYSLCRHWDATLWFFSSEKLSEKGHAPPPAVTSFTSSCSEILTWENFTQGQEVLDYPVIHISGVVEERGGGHKGGVRLPLLFTFSHT